AHTVDDGDVIFTRPIEIEERRIHELHVAIAKGFACEFEDTRSQVDAGDASAPVMVEGRLFARAAADVEHPAAGERRRRHAHPAAELAHDLPIVQPDLIVGVQRAGRWAELIDLYKILFDFSGVGWRVHQPRYCAMGGFCVPEGRVAGSPW